MSAENNNFVQPAIPRFDGHYDHWSMLMKNFLKSIEYWNLVESGILAVAVLQMKLSILKLNPRLLKMLG